MLIINGANEMTNKTDINRLGFLLTDVTRLFHQSFEREISLAGLEITPGEARALVRVSALEGARQSEIADQLGIEPMTLCRYLDKLEAAGLVARKSDPADRRAKRVITTDEAATVLEAVRGASDRVVRKMQSGLNAQQCDMMRASLKIMRENMMRFEDFPEVA